MTNVNHLIYRRRIKTIMFMSIGLVLSRFKPVPDNSRAVIGDVALEMRTMSWVSLEVTSTKMLVLSCVMKIIPYCGVDYLFNKIIFSYCFGNSKMLKFQEILNISQIGHFGRFRG